MPDTEPPLHPDLADLAPLLGEWSGQGSGSYPTIAPFDYAEAIVFGHTGKAFLTYVQRTRALDDGRALHGEAGFLRPAGHGRVELVVAQPTGVVEVDEGVVEVDEGRADGADGEEGQADGGEGQADGGEGRADGGEGRVEVDEGEAGRPSGGLSLVLRSRTVGTTTSAKEVTAVERTLTLDGGVLRTTLAMAAVGHPLTHHLASQLHRAAGIG